MSTERYDPERLRTLAVSETGFVFDPRTGHSYTCNPTGLAILAALKDGTPLDEIPERLALAFDAAMGSIEDDVAGFLDLLGDHGLAPRRARL
ncbi:MAG: PqqD family protein [Acidobacteriota bacterium]